MSVFRAKARRRAAAGLAAMVCAAAPSGGQPWAQTVEPSPVPLIPQNILRVQPPSAGALSAAPSTDRVQPSGFATTQARQSTQGIEVNPLAAVAPEAIGTLGAGNGGFGLDMWDGTPRNIIEGLLERLPSRMASRTMRELTRRLLLSVSPPPTTTARALVSASDAGQDAAAREADAPSRLLVLRAARLAELGEVPALISLLSVVPAHVEQEPLERMYVEALFLSHDRDEACRLVRNGITVHHAEPFWQKAMIFCNLAGGDVDRGLLGLDLLREQGVNDDPLFLALANRFAGVKGALPKVEAMTPLHLAMLRAAGEAFPSKMLDQAAPGILFGIATDPKAESAMRLAAAERACAQGIIDGAALAQSYESLPFTPEQLGNPIGAAAGMEGPEARALLYQAAKEESLPATRAEILRVALEEAAEDGLSDVAAQVYRSLIAEIDTTPQLAWFAASAGQALYGTGQVERAGAWLALARQEAIVDAQASAAVAALWPYSRMAGGDVYGSEVGVTAWRAMREAAGEAPSVPTVAWLRTAFHALGEQDSMAWRDLVAQSPESGPQTAAMPAASVLLALADASEEQRIGETVLLALIALGDGGPAQAHGMALGAALSALNRIGLGREARALAIEGALAHGI
jgi:hypothetical protein